MKNAKSKFRALYDAIQYFDKDMAKICLSNWDKDQADVVVEIVEKARMRKSSIYDLIIDLEIKIRDIDYFITYLMEE